MTDNTNIDGVLKKLDKSKSKHNPARKTSNTKKVDAKAKAKDPILGAPGMPQPPHCIEEKMKADRFPDREVNISETDDYEYKDPTLLIKNGKPWVPEEHGYRARLCTPEQRKYAGMGIWQKVYLDDNIRFADDEYNISRAQGDKVVDRNFGDASDGVYRNGAFLCLAPLEAAITKDNKQQRDAKDLVDASMMRSAGKLQEETGGNPKDSQFLPGPHMARRVVRIPNEEMVERARYANKGRTSVTVPAKIS